MTETTIRLKTLEDVRNFVNIVTRYDIHIALSSGRYIVDAKSIMGIFSLDLLSPIKLSAHTDDASKLFEELKDYIVKE